MKQIFFIAFLILSLIVAGCGGGNEKTAKNEKNKSLVAVSLPVKFPERWIIDGNELKKNLTEKGYEVNLDYAGENSERQIAFLNKAIEAGAKCLIIAPVDAKSLTYICEQAKSKDIKVISYDRFIMDTDAVDVYVTFNNTKVGTLMGEFVEDKLGLKQGRNEPANIEVFAGAPEDNNSLMVYNGYMSILKPYIDMGAVKVLSGESAFNQVSTEKWTPEYAEKRMDRVLKEHYQNNTRIDAVLAPNDLIANAIISSLSNFGYKAHYPLITGQDADKVAIINILNGRQAATVFKDTRDLAAKCAEIADSLIKGEKPEINDEKSYNNNKKIVPSYLINPVLVTKNNVQTVLIDSGYYKKSDLGME